MSLTGTHICCMIDLGTLDGLRRRDHELHAYCPRCGRWRVLDLEGLIARGQGGRRLPIRVRCLRCGEVGVLQVRPPMPGPAERRVDPATDVRRYIRRSEPVAVKRLRGRGRGVKRAATSRSP